MSSDDWIKGINRLVLPPDTPVTLQGGEPTLHPGIVGIINSIKPSLPIDILTNFLNDEWLYKINPARLTRKAPYASIRVSWHIGQNDNDKTLNRVRRALDHGYSIGIWAVEHPDYSKEVLELQNKAISLGIDFRLKEFLGPWKGKVYGTFRYPGSVNGNHLSSCECRTTELLVSPSGHIHRCHRDLYANRLPVGHILQEQAPMVGWLPCKVFGSCSSCDTKVKNNRYQQWGHSSVEIKNIGVV